MTLCPSLAGGTAWLIPLLAAAGLGTLAYVSTAGSLEGSATAPHAFMVCNTSVHVRMLEQHEYLHVVLACEISATGTVMSLGFRV